jgi:hypothetical protein
VRFYGETASEVQNLSSAGEESIDYRASFVADIAGEDVELDTAAVLESTRMTLEIQKAADEAE